MLASKATILKSLENERRKLGTSDEEIKELRANSEAGSRNPCFKTYAVEYYEQVQLAIQKMERLLDDYA